MKIKKKLHWVFLYFLFPAIAAADSDEALNRRIEQLEKKVEQLEKNSTGPKVRNQKTVRTQPRTSAASGPSRGFNPALSVNGLFRGTYRSRGNATTGADIKTGLEIQEVEVRLTGDVDPYIRGDITLSMEETDKIEIEEVIAEALLLHNLSVKAGKFFTGFGKHNLLHTHQFPFIDPPLVNAEILGDEGLNEIGVSLAYLLPTPWYMETIFQFLEGDNATLFDAPLNDDFAYLFHLRNLWDLTEETTLELGGSLAVGRNSLGDDEGTQVAGANLTMKWKPAGRERYQSLTWQTEFIGGYRGDVDRKGFYSFLQYQFAQRWWAQARYGFLNLRKLLGPPMVEDKNRYTVLLAFVPSEFSALRLQYNYLNHLGPDEHQAFLQLNFTFGSHPAHKY